MLKMKIGYLVAIFLLALVNIIIWNFFEVIDVKLNKCRRNPNYWCDTSWQCCGVPGDTNNTNANCPESKTPTPPNTTKTPKSTTGYYITNKYYGTGGTPTDPDYNYYHNNCIKPANDAIAASIAVDPTGASIPTVVNPIYEGSLAPCKLLPIDDATFPGAPPRVPGKNALPYYPQNNAYGYSTAPPEFNPGNFIGTGDYNGAVKQGNYYFTQPVGQATQSNFQYSAPSGSTNQNTVAFSGLNRFGYIRN
jgi:hypothetical protein